MADATRIWQPELVYQVTFNHPEQYIRAMDFLIVRVEAEAEVVLRRPLGWQLLNEIPTDHLRLVHAEPGAAAALERVRPRDALLQLVR